MKLDKNIVLGALLLILFTPAVLVGFLFYWLKLYFVAGMDFGEILYETISEWTLK